MGGKRDWLVLSLKWSRGGTEWLIWYKTDDAGYTTNLMTAGRYTEEEARSREDREDTLAVPLEAALGLAESLCVVEAGAELVDGLKAAARERSAKKSSAPAVLPGQTSFLEESNP